MGDADNVHKAYIQFPVLYHARGIDVIRILIIQMPTITKTSISIIKCRLQVSIFTLNVL